MRDSCMALRDPPTRGLDGSPEAACGAHMAPIPGGPAPDSTEPTESSGFGGRAMPWPARAASSVRDSAWPHESAVARGGRGGRGARSLRHRTIRDSTAGAVGPPSAMRRLDFVPRPCPANSQARSNCWRRNCRRCSRVACASEPSGPLPALLLMLPCESLPPLSSGSQPSISFASPPRKDDPSLVVDSVDPLACPLFRLDLPAPSSLEQASQSAERG
mmetsp:Transcript_27660/g.70172  ORF Transcript_27660/g.70172 Transcript_27660/m.70172 type:complete len:217 (+) Transcript_27660:168-818(+)